MLLEHRLSEASAQEPRLQMAKIPSIEGQLLDIVAAKQLAQMMRHEFIGHRLARRDLQKALRIPKVVGNAIGLSFLHQVVARKPEGWMHIPLSISPSDQHQRSQVAHGAEVEPAIDLDP